MASSTGERHDPETLALLRRVLDEAWEALGPEERKQALKSEIASRILKLANGGVRDPTKLRSGIIADVTGDGRKGTFWP